MDRHSISLGVQVDIETTLVRLILILSSKVRSEDKIRQPLLVCMYRTSLPKRTCPLNKETILQGWVHYLTVPPLIPLNMESIRITAYYVITAPSLALFLPISTYIHLYLPTSTYTTPPYLTGSSQVLMSLSKRGFF